MPVFTSETSLLDLARNLFTEDHARAPYNQYAHQIEYRYQSGKVQVPVAGPDLDGGERRACEIVSVSAPWGQKQVIFKAVRLGELPVVPTPEPAVPENEVLLDTRVVVQSPPLDQAGAVHTYVVWGYHVWALRRPIFPTDGLVMGKVPYDLTSKNDAVLPGQNFDSDLL